MAKESGWHRPGLHGAPHNPTPAPTPSPAPPNRLLLPTVTAARRDLHHHRRARELSPQPFPSAPRTFRVARSTSAPAASSRRRSSAPLRASCVLPTPPLPPSTTLSSHIHPTYCRRRHRRSQNTPTRSKLPGLQGSPLPMSAPTTRPTLPSPTPSPATTTRAAAGRASRPSAATASRHRTASCTAPCTAHAPYSHTLCACCAHCAPRPGVPRPRLRGVHLADPPITFMCAQYVMYAKHVDDDGVVIHDASGLLGFGFDKATLLHPPRCSSPRTPHAAPLHSRRRNALPPTHTQTHTASTFDPPGARLRCHLNDEVQGLPHV